MRNKKKKKKGNTCNDNTNKSYLPNVSICTPTFNRRPFFEGLIQCIREQDYPHKKIEWIVIDDGTDKVEDIITSDNTKELLGDITIRYFYYESRMELGKKRNVMHEKCSFKDKSDIIVYMDDDDYYPPERVSHSVKKLMGSPDALCGGSSELYLWFNVLDKMYKFGPYGPKHATAGTFAFRREFLNETSYQDDAVLAEEKHFLKNYTVPFVQFDSMKTILVVSHEQNTFDKKKLLSDKNKFVKESSLGVKHFIQNKELQHFYGEKINKLIQDYQPGDVKNKPKVLEEISRRETMRNQHAQQQVDSKMSGIFVTDGENKNRRELSIGECKTYMTNKTQECIQLKKEVERLKLENDTLREKVK